MLEFLYMKFSNKDLILVFIALAHLALIGVVFTIKLSVPVLILCGLMIILLTGTNYQCVSHNFLHNPFFKNEFLNQVFSIMNSLCLGLPQSLYREHHMNHHRYNNDPIKDDSSTYKYGKNGQEENVFSYSIIGVFRTNLTGLYGRAKRHGPLVGIELICVLLYFVLLLELNPLLFFIFYLPTWFFGQVFALVENYAEHHGATLHDRKRDSVSCYNKIYNLLWFNNGYHQEHHYRPMVHWTMMESVRDELPSDRKLAKGFHLTNLF